jgi:translocation protein SEC66
LAKVQPWYPDNVSKDLYFSLKETDQKVPDKLLKAALIRWAAEDIRQLVRMRECKPILTQLHQRGSVGDDIWTRFTTSEKLHQMEINELAQEANNLKPGWAQQMIQTATEVAQNESLRKRISEFPSQQEEYRRTYEEIRKSSLNELVG